MNIGINSGTAEEMKKALKRELRTGRELAVRLRRIFDSSGFTDVNVG